MSGAGNLNFSDGPSERVEEEEKEEQQQQPHEDEKEEEDETEARPPVLSRMSLLKLLLPSLLRLKKDADPAVFMMVVAITDRYLSLPPFYSFAKESRKENKGEKTKSD